MNSAPSGKPRLVMLLCMLAFGTVGLFVRGISLPSWEIALCRAAIALVVLTFFLLFKGQFKTLLLAGKSLWKFALSGAVMAFNWILLFEAYNHTSIALATLAYYTAPSLLILASAWFFKEKLSPLQLACFLLSSLGLVLMLGVSFGRPGDVVGLLLGMASAVLYTTVILLNKADTGVSGVHRTYVQFLAAALVMLVFTLLNGGFHLKSLSPGGWLRLLVLGVFHTGVCYVLYFYALARLKGQQVAMLSYLDPFTAVLLSVLVLGEAITPWQLLGGALMLAFTLLNETGRPFSRRFTTARPTKGQDRV